MTPGWRAAGPDLKPAVLPIAGGVGLRQPDYTLFAVEVEAVVGKHDRALANAAIPPGDLPGIELHRRQDRIREAVQVVADEHGRGVVVAHVAGEIHLLGGDALG